MRTALAVVFLKELRDALRDKRTAMMVFVASILTGPLTLILIAQFISGLEEKASTLKVRMVGQGNGPALVNFLQRNDVEIESAPEDYEARIKEGRLDAVIVVPKDFDEHYLAGDGAEVEIVYDDSRTESNPAIRQAERLLRLFNHETGTLRLMARGVSPGPVPQCIGAEFWRFGNPNVVVPLPPNVVPRRENKAVFCAMDVIWPLQSAQSSGAKLNPKDRISPTYGSDM